MGAGFAIEVNMLHSILIAWMPHIYHSVMRVMHPMTAKLHTTFTLFVIKSKAGIACHV